MTEVYFSKTWSILGYHDTLMNPAGNSEGFDKKMENPNGRGGLRLWKSEGMGG